MDSTPLAPTPDTPPTPVRTGGRVADLGRATTKRRTTSAPPAAVWEVLADGWLYPSWVVGASRARAVTPDWPAAGARLHHSVGVWPVVLDDETTVLSCEPGHRLLLDARTRPAGSQTVEIVLEPAANGGTRVSMREDTADGPLRLSPHTLRQVGLGIRNHETLHRLCLLAERRESDQP